MNVNIKMGLCIKKEDRSSLCLNATKTFKKCFIDYFSYGQEHMCWPLINTV